MATVGEIYDVSREFEWELKNILSLLENEEETRTSPLFAFADEFWHLKIYMNGDSYKKKEYMGVYLFRDKSGPPISLAWSVRLRTVEKRKNKEQRFKNVFETEGEGYGTSTFLKKSMLSELLTSDVLTIVCKLKYYSYTTDGPTEFQKWRDESKEKLERNKHSEVTFKFTDGEFQQLRNLLTNYNLFSNCKFKDEIKAKVESKVINETVLSSENSSDSEHNDEILIVKDEFKPKMDGMIENEDFDVTTKVEHEDLQHGNSLADHNPFLRCMFSPTKEDVLESEEIGNETTKVGFGQHKKKKRSNETVLSSENSSDSEHNDEILIVKVKDDEFKPKMEGMIENEDFDVTTKVEHEEDLQHGNSLADHKPFLRCMFSLTKEDVLESEEIGNKTTKVGFGQHRKKKRSEDSEYEFSSDDSGIITKMKDHGEFRCEDILYDDAPFCNYISDFVETVKRRKIIKSSVESESEDSTSSRVSFSSKNSSSISSKNSNEFFTKDSEFDDDSELSDATTNNEAFQLPTHQNVCVLYKKAMRYLDYQLKEECLLFMKNTLTVDTFSDYIVLAVKHDEKELLKYATELFCKRAKEIIHRVKWKIFLKNYPVQANELFIKALDANKA